MSTPLVFSFEGNEAMGARLVSKLKGESGLLEQRRFPDGETYIRILSEVSNRPVIIVCTQDNPDGKILPLLLLSKALRDHGAATVILVAPYLAYMRQDKIFRSGEALSSIVFAQLLSQSVDRIITVDPHLHRHKHMTDIYSVPCTVLHAAPLIAEFIRKKITRPLIIGPDSESAQWVSQVASAAGSPFLVLEKTRKGDREVQVIGSSVESYRDYTPVLVDDIISTAATMVETVRYLRSVTSLDPVCVAIHGIFAGKAFSDLERAGVRQIVTCNTIVHQSNQIDVSDMIAAHC